MKTNSIISMLVVLLLVLAATLTSREKLIASNEMTAPFDGYVYQYGSCNNQIQVGASYTIYNVTTSTLLKTATTDSTGLFSCACTGISMGHTIRVTASYGARCRTLDFVQTESGLEGLSVCLLNCGPED